MGDGVPYTTKADSQMIDLICQLFRNVTSD